MGVRAEFEKHSNFIAAVLTFLTPILTVWLAVAVGAQGDAENRVDALERQAAADRTANNTLRGTNDQLQREIEERDRRIAALEGQVPSPGPDEGSADARVRHDGEVTLAANGEYVDMNAPQSEKRWGTDRVMSNEIDSMHFAGSSLYFQSAQVLELSAGQPATYETCTSATGYSDPYVTVDVSKLTGDPGYCFRMASGRYATVRTLDYVPGEKAKLRITTWEAP